MFFLSIFTTFAAEMKLQVFNPEHDIALASNLANFTAPHAGRQLRADLGYLPALWAEEGDMVLVDHVESAEKAFRKVAHRLRQLGCRDLPVVDGRFTGSKQPAYYDLVEDVLPWGWNLALRATLKRYGVREALLPTEDQIAEIRQLSHRRTAARLLPLLQMEGTVGESFECTTADEVEALLARYGQVVMKAPWSSSGRGLRFLSTERTPFQMQAGWFRNLVAQQGSVMVEPLYDKVKDFGMEFCVDDAGIHYLGLSLFHTINGAYVGNILATERVKQEMISRYVPIDLLDRIKRKIADTLNLGSYRGPFGVDMMLVWKGNYISQLSIVNFQLFLHPCVEINLRRTMGHVALAISPTDDDIQRVMRIVYDGTNYQLKIQRL